MPGIILSGGYYAEQSVEVFDPSTGLSCSLPDLPYERYYHTMDGLLICGGEYSSTSCLSFTSGQWNKSHTLVEPRYFHTSWQSEDGLVLMAGSSSRYSSEIVAKTGGQEGPSFPIKYKTR
jgi:hypothetical protein